MPNAVLGIFLSNKCNISCRHCGTRSGPHEKQALHITPLLADIASLSSEVIKAIHISGGEPFLYPYQLSAIGNLCAAKELYFAINTNGFWGRNPDIAKSTLIRIPGLNELFISTDIYHNEYLDLETIRNCCVAASELHIRVSVCFCTAEGIRDQFVDYAEHYLSDLLAKGIRFQINPLELGGRANSLPEAHWRKLDRDFPEGRCLQINKPVILENGDVFACCNTEAAARDSHHPLIVGNVANNSLAEIFLTKQADPLLRAIRCLGPAALARLLPPSLKQELRGQYEQGLPCSLCIDLLDNEAIVRFLRELLSQPRFCDLMDAVLSMLDGERIEVHVPIEDGATSCAECES
jgi:hypothetical protein